MFITQDRCFNLKDSHMARSESEAKFDNLMIKNKDTFLKNRGAKSPFLQIDAPYGAYYARIVSAPRNVIEVDRKDPTTGKSTGFKDPIMRVQLQVSIVCSAENNIAQTELEQYSGSSGFIDYRLPIGDDDAIKRFYGDLEQIGINTKNLQLTESDITDSENQFTLAQVCELLEQEKPFCRISIIEGKSVAGSKFINYRGTVNKEDVEQLLGRTLDDSEENVQTDLSEKYIEVPSTEAPFEGTESQPDLKPVDIDGVTYWHDAATDTYYDNAGQEVILTEPEPEPLPAPKVAPAVRRPPTPAPAPKAAPVPAPVSRSSIAKPGAKPAPSKLGAKRP